jgi:glyoxylase-like metal-dependent hydrolase (beta-lactamase superfamily II)
VKETTQPTSRVDTSTQVKLTTESSPLLGQPPAPPASTQTSRTMAATTTPPFGDEGYWTTSWREYRHNPCLMAPLSLIMFLVFGLFLLCTLLFQIPGMLLGLLLGPILVRGSWYVEFLYPWDIGRWAHMMLIQHASRGYKDEDRNRGFHSRCVEQKMEVVKGRVYIHPIPQLLDNLGYLIVSLPRPQTEQIVAQHNHNDKITVEDTNAPIVAIMVDCGDAPATIKAIDLIQQYHYRNRTIQIQSICSTHKHHDHTGGNKGLIAQYKTIHQVYGGAVERVPHCTDFLVNGQHLVLPKFGTNDMSQHIEIEAVAVPSHTRGSIVYRLSTKTTPEGAEYLFTGDTMFSAGGGVPFEADSGQETDAQINKSNGNTFIRAGIGSAATERCFAEILSRAMPHVPGHDIIDKIMIFPGHEYTNELLTRQFQTTMMDSCRWKNFPPRDFFETVSQMYVALHRRTLPHNSGKLLAVPSPLKREICISPNFRSMKRTGELVVRAIAFWHSYFCKNKVVIPQNGLSKNNGTMKKKNLKDSETDKTPSLPTKWNVDVNDVNRDVFTTFYTADFESVIAGLDQGQVSKKDAVKQLRDLQTKLDQPVVNRRPIPGYLPSDKNIYKGVCGLALLGSPPSAMSLSDSRTMKLPPPIDSNSDRILVSRQRLTTVLERLGLFPQEQGGDDIRAMTVQLWKEAREYKRDKSDVETDGNDEIELGILKWVLWGVPANQPSWFSKVCCMPCSKTPAPQTFPDHPAMAMKQKAGDLVSHDVMQCLLCRNATGCVHVIEGGSIGQPLRLSAKETVSDDSTDDGVEMESLANPLCEI